MRWLADITYLIVGLLYLPIAAFQALVYGKHRSGWRERFGSVPQSVWSTDGSRPRIWIHAVSLGEINATPKLVAALTARRPELDIVFSCTTDTGYERALALYGTSCVFRYPLDFSFVVNRVLDRIRPTMIVLVELEVWYNLVRLATARGVPVAVVNGRLTSRSAKRLSWLTPLTRPMFSDLAWVGAQDETIAGRFRKVGVRPTRIEVTSSLKWDSAAVADRVEGAASLGVAMGIDSSTSLWVCGSTGPGEEEVILRVFRALVEGRGKESRAQAGSEPMVENPLAQLVIVPRKPERFDEVAGLIERSGFACVRRSRRPDGSPMIQDRVALQSVFLGDTMGELRKFYSLADVVFVGRSMVPLGGSDPMEVAALGKPILTGRFMDNFEMPTRALKDAEALRVVESAALLEPAVRELLSNRDRARAMGLRGREVVLRNLGATARTAARLIEILEKATIGTRGIR